MSDETIDRSDMLGFALPDLRASPSNTLYNTFLAEREKLVNPPKPKTKERGSRVTKDMKEQRGLYLTHWQKRGGHGL